MFYIFEVRDDENMSIPTQEFDTFANAFDYAQDGLTTMIYRIPLDGEAPIYEEAEPVWDWSNLEDRDTLVKVFDGENPTPVEGTMGKGDRNTIDDFDFQVQPEEMFFEDLRTDLLQRLNSFTESKDEISEDDLSLAEDSITKETKYVLDEGDCDEKLELDKKGAFNNALTLAKKENKPVVYGYANKKYPGKFYSLPLEVCDNPESCSADIRKQYGANVVHIAYPDKNFVEACNGSLKESLTDKEIEDLFIEKYGNDYINFEHLSDDTVGVVYHDHNLSDDKYEDEQETIFSIEELEKWKNSKMEACELDETKCKDYDVINHTPDELEVLDEEVEKLYNVYMLTSDKDLGQVRAANKEEAYEKACYLWPEYISIGYGLDKDELTVSEADEDDMSDEEFVEALGKALREKCNREELTEGKFGDFINKAASKVGQATQKATDAVGKAVSGIKSGVQAAKTAFSDAKEAEKYKTFKQYFKPNTLNGFVSTVKDGKQDTKTLDYKGIEDLPAAVTDFKKVVQQAGTNLVTAVLKAEGIDNKEHNILFKGHSDPNFRNSFVAACNAIAQAAPQANQPEAEPAAEPTTTEEKPVEAPKAEEKPVEAPVENKPVETPAEQPATPETQEVSKAEEKPVEAPTKTKYTAAQLTNMRKNNGKILKAFKDAGLDVSKLTTKATDKNGREFTKASSELNNLRRALFGESVEEDSEE